jgi:pimeloyl-ACP methyl ester carboxylesterase
MRYLLVSVALGCTLAAPLSAASVDGIKIHSTSAGAGKTTIVFVHGWTCDSSSWAGQVPALTVKYRVITLDLPGHGQSGSPSDGRFSMDLFARAVEAVRAESKADQIVLVGHSMGAAVIRQFARLHPRRVSALVAVDGPLDMRGFGAGMKPPPLTGADGRKAREAMIQSMFVTETPKALQQQILTMMLKAPEATAVGAMNAMFDPANAKADVTTAPALAVYAATAQVPKAEDMRKVLPNYEGTQMAGTGHFLMMEEPKQFNDVLLAFLLKNKL